MYNSAFPQTPAPPLVGARFSMSAAILETPSIMSSFRKSSAACVRAEPVKPPAMQFVTSSFTANSWNDCMQFSSNALMPQTGGATAGQTYRTQGLNNSFLNTSSASGFIKPASMQKIMQTNSNAMMNRSFMVHQEKSSATLSASRCPALNNFHQPAKTAHLNSTVPLFKSNTTLAKRKYNETAFPTATAGQSKQLKPSAGFSKKLTPAAASPEEGKRTIDSKATLRIVSGTIDHIQKVMREQPKHPLLLEIVANILAIKPGTRPKEKIVLLRNLNAGPVLQAVYYEIDGDLPLFAAGDLVRCVGRIQPVRNRLQILKITRAPERYDRAIARLQTVSAFTTKVRR